VTASMAPEPLIARSAARGVAPVLRPVPALGVIPVLLRLVPVPATPGAGILITGFPVATARLASGWTARHQPHRCARQDAS